MNKFFVDVMAEIISMFKVCYILCKGCNLGLFAQQRREAKKKREECNVVREEVLL